LRWTGPSCRRLANRLMILCLRRSSILEKLFTAALADQVLYIGGLVSQRFAKCPVGEDAGAKGLPEGLARLFGHDVLAVIAGYQHHYMAGALPAFVTAMDFTRRVLVVQVAHKGAREESGRPSYPSPLGSQSLLADAVSRLTFLRSHFSA
jgi:hypothetical protein